MKVPSIFLSLDLRLHFTVQLHPLIHAITYFGEKSSLNLYPNKPVRNFALKFSFYFCLIVKPAMSTTVFLSTARKKQKDFFCSFILVKNEES